MRGQPNRLAAETAGPFAGSAIDRSKPLTFRLDGRRIDGFAGDSVLSAVLAAGIDSVGRRRDGAMALSSRFAPAIIAASQAHAPQHALAMDRTPATAGAEYVTLPVVPAWRARLRQVLPPRGSLGLALADGPAPTPPFMNVTGSVESSADVIVVGGGVAGMTAALEAAQAGLRVILVEKSPRLGGSARLFGTLEGEETADASLLRLRTAVGSAAAITVLTRAAAFATRPGAVRVHVIDSDKGPPTGRVVDLHASRIVLATGAVERLPVFAGNCLPGTVGVREAYGLAQHYGVWPGQSALLATSSNVAYRLAMLARDAGIAIPRLLDSRTQPQSRFIEFSRAYGITQAPGTLVVAARPAPQARSLAVSTQLRVDRFSRDEPLLMADRLVVCGGWQPDLHLWHMAGGTSQWDAQSQILVPGAGPEGLVLAGNAAGYRGHQACLASGAAAIDRLLGRAVRPVAELAVDPIFESLDGATPAAPPAERGYPAFLDAGRSGVLRPEPLRTVGKRAWDGKRGKAASWSMADGALALATADIAAGVQLGAIAPERAGTIARERVAMLAMDSAPAPAPASTAPLVPAFLTGRFGPDAQLWQICPAEARALDPGALIQVNGDVSDPLVAVGVVLRHGEGDAVALVAASQARAGQALVVREQGRATAVRLVAPYSVGTD